MKFPSSLRSRLVLAASSLLAVSSASAQIYWDGTTASWNAAANWTTAAGAATPNPLAVPGASDDTIFNRTGQNSNVTIYLDADQAAQSLTFNSTGTTTIRGNTSGTTARSLTIGSGGITKNSGSGSLEFGSGGNTFYGLVNIALSADQTWTNNSTSALSIGTRYLSSATDANVALGAFNLIIDGTGNMNIGVSNQAEAALTGTGTLTKNGTGVLQMGGANTGYTGNVTINGGVVNTGDATASGIGTGNILLNGGVLETRWSTGISRAQGTLGGQIQITGGVSGISGGGSGSGAATHNIGAITWGGATFNPTEFVLQSGNAGAGTTTLSSAINLNGDDPGATPDGNGVVWRTIRSNQGNLAGSGTFSGAITNSGTTNQAGLIKTGVGQHILSGTNTYNGGTQVNQGILTATTTAALPGWNTSGKVTVADGATLGVRTGASWTAANIDTLRGAVTWSASGSRLGIDTTGANFSYGSDITEALSVAKIGGNTLTLSGNNSYTGSTTLWGGTVIANSANALGNGGDITFLGGTLQYTASSAGNNYGSRIKNSTSAMLLNTNSQDVTLSGIAAGNTGGLTKSGAGKLTLTGTNTYTGTTAISAGTFVIDGGTTSIGDVTLAASTSMSIINGGTLNTAGVIGDDNLSNLTWSVIGGGATSTWNLGGSNFNNYGYSPVKSNNDMTIDGAGVAASAVVTNIQDLQWGRSTLGSDLLVTNGGRLSVNRDVQIGSTYYGETGINNTITIQGGTANSLVTVGRDFYVGYGDRAAASSNTTTVATGGQLTVTQDTYVGHVNNTANTDNPATANQLLVSGGTASMRQLSVGFADADGRDTPANVVAVSNGGQISTTGVAYIGRADNPTSTSNANTLTVTGTGSSWNAGNQNVLVGFTNNASAVSNNNILTVGAGGTVTGVAALTVGSGAGTETGNQLVVNGSLSATSVSISANNTLAGAGTLSGNVTLNGTLTPGNSIGALGLTGNLGFGSTGSYSVDVDGTSATSDQTIVTGGVTINAATTLVPNVTGTLVAGQKFFIVVNDDSDLVSGTFAGLGQDSQVGGPYGGVNLKISYTGDSVGGTTTGGNDIVLYAESAGSTPYQIWATGGEEFEDDANNDGISNGLAFLLGADGPNAAVTKPSVTETSGGLVLSFSMRNAAARGDADLYIEHSRDVGVGDPWTAVLVPDETPDPQASDVHFTIVPGSPLNGVTATIQAGESGGTGKLFGRLKGVNP